MTTHPGPAAGPALRWIGRTWLRVFGWTIDSRVPDVPAAVFVAAPHTTGWDLPFTLAVGWALDMRVSWVAKEELFRGPWGGFFRWAGGVPVVRDKKKDQVRAIADAMRREQRVFLVIAPSGTRAARDYWKSGFYHIARAADAPLLLAYLDYARKRGGLGPTLWPSGDLRADMDQVREFYRDKVGKHPHLQGTPRLREEGAGEASEPAAVSTGSRSGR